MTDRMIGHFAHAEVLTEPQRRRRWTPAQKLSMVQETYEPDVTVSLVARRHGVQLNQLFAWRKLASQGALTATSAQEEVVAASDYRALQRGSVRDRTFGCLSCNDVENFRPRGLGLEACLRSAGSSEGT